MPKTAEKRKSTYHNVYIKPEEKELHEAFFSWWAEHSPHPPPKCEMRLAMYRFWKQLVAHGLQPEHLNSFDLHPDISIDVEDEGD